MITPALKRRLHASGIHLAISALVLLVPLYLIFYSWFPAPYFDSDGGLQAAVILSMVHFFIGPVLTFVIFSPDKSMGKIKFDFVVIGLLQVAALTFGSYIFYNERPVIVVFANDKFLPVSANVIHQQRASVADLRAFGAQSPALVFSRPPADKEDFAQMMLLALNDGIDIVAQVKTFEPLRDHLTKVAGNGTDPSPLVEENSAFGEELESFLKARGARKEDYIYVPFNGRYKKILFVIDQHGRLAGALYSAYNS